MSDKHRQVRRNNKDVFSIFLNMKVCCLFSLELPHRGDFNEYTQHTIINVKKKKPTKIIPNTIMAAAMSFVW